jgi:hypothetical protein
MNPVAIRSLRKALNVKISKKVPGDHRAAVGVVLMLSILLGGSALGFGLTAQASYRSPAATTSDVPVGKVDARSQRAKALYLMLQQLERDQKSGKAPRLKEGHLVWKALSASSEDFGGDRARTQEAEEESRLLMTAFLKANDTNPAVRDFLYQEDPSKIPVDANLTFRLLELSAPKKLRQAAQRMTWDAQLQLAEVLSYLNPVKPREEANGVVRGDSGFLAISGYMLSSTYGQNRELARIMGEFEGHMKRLRDFLRASPDVKTSTALFRGLPLFGAYVWRAVDAARAGKPAVFQLATQQVGAFVDGYVKFGRMPSIRDVQTRTWAEQLARLGDQIRIAETREGLWSANTEAAQLTAQTVGVLVMFTGSLLAMASGVGAPVGLAGLNGALIVGSQIMGAAYAGHAGVSILDQASRGSEGFMSRDDYTKLGMNGAMMVTMGLARGANAQVFQKALAQAAAAGKGSSAAVAAKAMQGAAAAINAGFTAHQAWNAATMMANAEKLANENVTVEMIRQQAFLEGLMAIVGFKQAKHDLKLMGVNSGLLARTVKRYAPEAGKVKIEGDQEAFLSQLRYRAGDGQLQGFKTAVDLAQQHGVPERLASNLSELEAFEARFLDNPAAHTDVNAKRYELDFTAKAKALRAEADALEGKAKKERQIDDQLRKTANEIYGRRMAALLYESGARAARYVRIMSPLWKNISEVQDRARFVDDLIAQNARENAQVIAMKNDYLSGKAISLVQLGDRIDNVRAGVAAVNSEINVLIQGVANSIRKIDEARLGNVPERESLVALQEDLKGLRGSGQKLAEILGQEDAEVARLAGGSRSSPADERGGGGTAVATRPETAVAAGKVNLREMDAFRDLPADTRAKLEVLFREDGTRRGLEDMISSKLSEARRQGISDAAFNRILSEAYRSCAR